MDGDAFLLRHWYQKIVLSLLVSRMVDMLLPKGIPYYQPSNFFFSSSVLADIVGTCTWGEIDALILVAQYEAELRKPDALLKHRDRLPTTIQGAIRLCPLLGERYLWVVSLCIMQDTPDKHTQIQRMDLIHQSAAICITAAVGSDANAGLPGSISTADQATAQYQSGVHSASE